MFFVSLSLSPEGKGLEGTLLHTFWKDHRNRIMVQTCPNYEVAGEECRTSFFWGGGGVQNREGLFPVLCPFLVQANNQD